MRKLGTVAYHTEVHGKADSVQPVSLRIDKNAYVSCEAENMMTVSL